MSEAARGVMAMAVAAAIWGVSSLLYKALANVPPLEILAHRTIWSAVFLGLVLLAQRRGAELRAGLREAGNLRTLGIAALLISSNWLAFIYAVQSGAALEASLGYYIFPLVAVALGYLVLGERFSAGQTLAIALATGAVLVMSWGLGSPPWLALIMAFSFGFYGLVKKRLALGPAISVFVETLLLAPLALVFLFGMKAGLWTDLGGRVGGLMGSNWREAALLVLAGPITGWPLLLFAYATRRVSYATIGLVQYLNPTIQFFMAVLLYGEPFTHWDAVAFPMIWAALAVYSLESWRREKSSRSASISSGTVA